MLEDIFPPVICDIILEYSKLTIIILTKKGYLYQLVDAQWKFLFKFEIDLKNDFHCLSLTDTINILIDKTIHTLNTNNEHRLLTIGGLPNNWKDFQIAHIGTDIYFIGGNTTGFFGRCALDRVYKFNTDDHSWKKMACMKYARTNHNVVVLNNRIYAFGGENETHTSLNVTRRTEYYDISKNKWIQVKKMIYKRYYQKSVVYNNKIYTFGYSGNRGYCRYFWYVEKYDPDLDKWTYCCEMNEYRRNFTVLAHENYIYVIGGLEYQRFQPKTLQDMLPRDCTRIERFDPTNNKWMNLTLQAPPFGECEAGIL